MAFPGRITLSLRTGFVLFTGAAFLLACAADAAAPKKRKKSPVDPPDSWYDDEVPVEEQPIEPAYVNEDSGAFGASSRPAKNDKDGGTATPDGGLVTKIFCLGPLAAGDLVVSELLIASRAGSGDDGEWVEITSTRDCWLRIQGVTVESPRGQAAPNVAKVEADVDLAPKGTFVVADSLDPAKNYGITGKVIAWNAADVLKNDGDTIAVKSGETVIDTVTYPTFNNLETGRSLAFPSDCAPAVRTDWKRWSLTFTDRAPGQRGTPNAANDDVACF
jgi:hypothetical protein